MLDKKAFLNSYQGNSFFLINFGNQELIHHINSFEYKFFHQNKTIKFC